MYASSLPFLNVDKMFIFFVMALKEARTHFPLVSNPPESRYCQESRDMLSFTVPTCAFHVFGVAVYKFVGYLAQKLSRDCYLQILVSTWPCRCQYSTQDNSVYVAITNLKVESCEQNKLIIYKFNILLINDEETKLLLYTLINKQIKNKGNILSLCILTKPSPE